MAILPAKTCAGLRLRLGCPDTGMSVIFACFANALAMQALLCTADAARVLFSFNN